MCLGNPPYDRQQRTDDTETQRGGWIRWGDGVPGAPQNAPLEAFIAPARAAGQGRHIKNLYNDYVYFWRWALWKTFEHGAVNGAEIHDTSAGIVCFITAASYLRGPGFVGMRQAMRETFDELWILDLEGDSRGARPTENMFNIQTGVAIALGVRTSNRSPDELPTPAKVRYAKLTGSREQKFSTLDAVQSLGDVEWRDCPTDWMRPFLPLSDASYWDWPEMTDLFPWQQSGVKYGRTWPVGETQELLKQRWQTLMHSPDRAVNFDQNSQRTVDSSYYALNTRDRQPPVVSLPRNTECPSIARYGFRSFDRQWCIADNRLGDRMSPEFWKVRSRKQVFMVSFLTEVLGDGPSATVAAHIPDLHFFRGSFGGKHAIPFWRDAAATQPNVTGGLLARLGERWNAPAPRAQDLFAYCYALLTPRAYVQTFADELLLPGPRIPVTADPALFAQVAALGHELIRLHTFNERNLETDNPPPGETTPGAARCVVAVSPDPAGYPETYRYDTENQILHVGGGEFAPVSPAVWNYSVSGLRVVRSWLDYRKKEPNGKSSSPLDKIRPQSWTAALTDELLDVLWTLEKTLDLEPQATELLETVLKGPLINAADLPQPAPLERLAPGGDDITDQQAQLEI